MEVRQRKKRKSWNSNIALTDCTCDRKLSTTSSIINAHPRGFNWSGSLFDYRNPIFHTGAVRRGVHGSRVWPVTLCRSVFPSLYPVPSFFHFQSVPFDSRSSLFSYLPTPFLSRFSSTFLSGSFHPESQSAATRQMFLLQFPFPNESKSNFSANLILQ